MPFQALFLAVILLLSLLVSGTNSALNRYSKTQNIINASGSKPVTNTDAYFFIKDFQSAFSNKAVSAKRGLNENLALASESINQSVGFLNENLAAAEEIASLNVNGLFTKFQEAAPGDNQSGPLPFLSSQSLKIQNQEEQSFPCSFNDKTAGLTSQVALVKDLDAEVDVFKLNTEKRWPIASLSKLMTSVITVEKIGWDKEINMDEKAVSTEGNAGDFQVGEVFTSGDLIKAMLVVSSNDAAEALAESMGEKNFVDEMQKKAMSLKMFDTTYLEPTGLSFINQSTVYDLSNLAIYIYQNHPELLEISRQKETEITELKSNKTRKLVNIDKFAGENDFIGGKTGYIDESGHNLIAFFDINGRKFLSIVLGADDPFKDTKQLKDMVQRCL